MKAPKPFGYPLYSGISLRVAKKYFPSHWTGHWKQLENWLYSLEHIQLGDLFSGCDGLNTKLVKVVPEYIYIHGGGKILVDMSLDGETNSCSLFNCGVTPPKTYEQCEEYKKQTILAWENNDKWEFAKRYKDIDLNPDGTPNYKKIDSI